MMQGWQWMYRKEPFSVYMRFGPDSGRFSDASDHGLRSYTENQWFPYSSPVRARAPLNKSVFPNSVVLGLFGRIDLGMWGKWEMSVCSMPGEIDAYLTDYNWAAALAKFFSNTGNSDSSIHRISWR